MTGEPDPLDDALIVSRALRKRGVSMRCPACDWTLDGPLGDYLLTPTGDEQGFRPGIKLAVYACGNCGYVRLHSANVLRKTLDEG
jgi:predicted RNA-binding Zn-ribbon protein involved in translation (DUF1610 family)